MFFWLFTESCGIPPSSVTLRVPASPQGEAFGTLPSPGRWIAKGETDEVFFIPQETVKNRFS